MNLFGSTISKLESGLNYATKNNNVISNNIANIDTPNFKSQKVQFKDVLADESQKATRTHEKHLPFTNSGESGYKVISNHSTVYNNNGNNVDVDKEMTELAKNQIYYQGLVDRMNGKFKSIQTVLRGGNA
ncbi:MAG TPA: flagellar basal body rod protein FlgB [Candidatus Avamphibacillus intestinigallinarum]|nr:flagellar basal body rod protein FlgB [Candidatus Avamphibacillus intestinigallinarum]